MALKPDRRRGRRGLAALEFAFVAPVFFLLILGMIEVGRGLMVVHLLNNAARDGCRSGILTGASNDNVTSGVSSAVSGQGLSGYTVTVKVNGTVANASTANTGDKISVIVSIPVANVTWLPGGQYLTGSLSGQCTLPRE